MPDDEEVAAADAKEEEAKVLHRLATDWDRSVHCKLNFYMKGLQQ